MNRRLGGDATKLVVAVSLRLGRFCCTEGRFCGRGRRGSGRRLFGLSCDCRHELLFSLGGLLRKV